MSNGTAVGRWKRLDCVRRDIVLRIDGQPVPAFEGETILTVTLCWRAWLRTFEFGDEYRAGFCLIGACQDCWVHLSDGTPVRACTTFVTDGMEIVTDGCA